MNVVVTGPGNVTPAGTSIVVSGANLDLQLSGSLVALYDNGENVTAQVSENAYSVANVVAPHDIVAVFTTA